MICEFCGKGVTDPSIIDSDTDTLESKNARELKDRYAFLFANSRDIILYIRYSDGQIVEANEAAVKEYGYSHEELLGMTLFDLRKLDSVKLVEEQLKQANEHGILIQSYHIRKDGSAFPVESSSQGTTINDDRILLSIIRNVSERKQAEAELKNFQDTVKETEFEKKVMSDLAYDWESWEDETGRFRYISPACEKTSGYTINEFLGNKALFASLVVEEDKELWANHRHCVEVDKGLYNVQFRIRNKDGKIVWIEHICRPVTDENGKNRGYRANNRDITDRKQAEAELLQQAKSQAILLKILKQFSSVVAEDIDDVINTTLQIIGEFDDNDRSYIFELSVDGLAVNNTHEWCSEGIQSQIASMQNLPVDTIPWWMEKLRRFENIYVPLVDDLPPKAQHEKEILQAQAILSLLAVPIAYEDNLIGFLGFDSVKKRKIWSENNVSTLELMAHIFAVALQRKKYVMSIRESENYYRAIFDNTGAATLIIEEDLTITNVNEECQKLLGYAREELIGKKWTDFIPDSNVATTQEYHNKHLLNLAAVPLKYTTQLVDRQGKYRDGLVEVDIVSGTNSSVVNFIDFTEFNRIDRALKALSGVNQAIIYAEREEDLLWNVCRKIVEMTGYSLVWTGYLQGDPQQTVKIVASAGKDDGYLAKLNISLQDPIRGNGPAATAIRTGQRVILADFRKDDTIRPWLTDALQHGFKSGIAIPLMADNKAFGVLCIYSGETDRIDSDEEILILEMVNDLAYAIMSLRNRTEKMQTAEELKKSLKQMRHILMQSVTSLGNATDVRDPYTAGHQKNVALLAAAIAAEMGLSKDQIEGISVMGNLHDVGKIYVPIEILNRSNRLSEIEFALIKAHSQAGYDIVRNIEFPWPVAEVILQHHERMDGSGYPRGLTGEDILVEARILGVADVVEAMASHRPYRPALGIGPAMEEIAQNRGILYDPTVVDACLKLLREKTFKFE